MAFSGIATRGSAVVGGGSNASVSVNPTATITVGKIVFVQCFSDNSLTVDGSSTDRHSVSDSQGNTWNRIAEYTETDGATDDGVCVSMWWSKITTQLSTTDTITLSPAVNQSDMIIDCFEVTVGAGNTVAIETVGVGQGTATVSVAGLPSREYLFVYAAGAEGEDNTKTGPTSYTELYDTFSSTSGALDANLSVSVAARIQTTTSSGSVASTGWTGTNFMSLLAAVYETAALTHYTMPASAGSLSLTGVDAGLKRSLKLTAAQGSYSLTGQSATLSKGKLIALDAGSLTITGQNATLRATRRITAAQGSLALSGQTASLKADRKLSAAQGSYVITGQDATLTNANNFSLSAEQGSLSLSGQAVTLRVTKKLPASVGSYTSTGQSAAFKVGRKVSADQGSYVITGNDASFTVRSSIFPVESGEYTLTGVAVSFTRGRVLSAASSSYSLTGSSVAFTRTYVLAGEAGVYGLSGLNASLFKPGEIVRSKVRLLVNFNTRLRRLPKR